MCLLVVIPRGVTSEARTDALSILAASWSSNPHGAGLAYASQGQLIIQKPYWRWRPLKKTLKRLMRQHGDQSDFLIHLRFATAGAMDELNTHPHLTARGCLALAHNGILQGMGDKVESDTVQLAKGLMRADPQRLCLLKSRDALGRRIGMMNKLALLDAEGVAHLVNEQEGTWQDGVWYSDPFALLKASAEPMVGFDWSAVDAYWTRSWSLNNDHRPSTPTDKAWERFCKKSYWPDKPRLT